MKALHFAISAILLLVLSACDKDNEVLDGNYGSNRDWTYTAEQVEFFIDGVEQTQVQEITVRSKHLPVEGANPPFPWYLTTLKVKGLLSKNKITEIEVLADVERFEGTTTLNGVEYDVTGVYTGSPFQHYTEMGISVVLDKK